jgi:hypothetical protein
MQRKSPQAPVFRAGADEIIGRQKPEFIRLLRKIADTLA